MYHYLATKDGHNIADIEPWVSEGTFEFTGGVCNIKHFLSLYDTIPLEKRDEFKRDFSDIDELRGWFFEYFYPMILKRKVSEEGLKQTHEYLRAYLKRIATKWGLYYGED